MQEHPWLKYYPDDVDWNMPIPSGPVYNIFDEAAERYSNRPFLDFMGKSYDYGEIAQLIKKLTLGLQEMGVKKGDKVGLFLPNCPYFVMFYFAILKAGGTVVNYNPLYSTKEVSHQIDDSQTKIMVTLDLKKLTDKLEKARQNTCLEKLIICPMADILPFPKNFLFNIFKKSEKADIPWDDTNVIIANLLQNTGDYTPVEIDPDEDLAVLQYTGGTTGVPKGAMLTHANVYANTLQATSWFAEARPGEEIMMGVLPFFHVFAMTVVMLLSIRLGAKIIMVPRFELGPLLKSIDKEKPTLFPAVPTIYGAINGHRDLAKYDLSSIQLCISGGAPLPVEIKKSFEKTTGCKLVEGYGLTESSPVATVNPINGQKVDGSIGIPLPGTIIEIVSLEDHKTIMPLGKKGEVCIRGPQVMKGYWNKKEATDEVLKDGRLHTGDVGTMDEMGFTYIVDRIKDMILCSGYNVYPRNVEEAVYQHPKVKECIVLGVPDEYRGETIKVYVTLEDGVDDLTLDELKEFLTDKLSKIQMPTQLEIRGELPKTMIGKLSRKELREEMEKAS